MSASLLGRAMQGTLYGVGSIDFGAFAMVAIVLLASAVILAGALGMGRALVSLVYGVPLRDPATFASVVFALTAISLAACVIPVPPGSEGRSHGGIERRVTDRQL